MVGTQQQQIIIKFMINRKGLQIETQFFDDNAMDIPDAVMVKGHSNDESQEYNQYQLTSSPHAMRIEEVSSQINMGEEPQVSSQINMQQEPHHYNYRARSKTATHLQSAVRIEKILSLNVMFKFEECWNTLKSLILSHSVKRLLDLNDNQNFNQQMHQQMESQMVINSHNEWLSDKKYHKSEKRFNREIGYDATKSYRRKVEQKSKQRIHIEREQHYSKAKLLKKIVDKLQYSKIETPERLPDQLPHKRPNSVLDTKLTKIESLLHQINSEEKHSKHPHTPQTQETHFHNNNEEPYLLKLADQLAEMREDIKGIKSENMKIIDMEKRRELEEASRKRMEEDNRKRLEEDNRKRLEEDNRKRLEEDNRKRLEEDNRKRVEEDGRRRQEQTHHNNSILINRDHNNNNNNWVKEQYSALRSDMTQLMDRQMMMTREQGHQWKNVMDGYMQTQNQRFMQMESKINTQEQNIRRNQQTIRSNEQRWYQEKTIHTMPPSQPQFSSYGYRQTSNPQQKQISKSGVPPAATVQPPPNRNNFEEEDSAFGCFSYHP